MLRHTHRTLSFCRSIIHGFSFVSCVAFFPLSLCPFFSAVVAGPTPMAVMVLIDSERMWFKSCVGMPSDDIPRLGGFCAYTILHDDVFEIPDATQDWRFADSVEVTEHKIRFYAGAPLINSDGFSLGSLCVLDAQPRRLTEQQRSTLIILAQQTVAQLELRKYVAHLHDTKEALEQSIAVVEAARREADHARSEADKANQAKSTFLSNMSHEIRTPMNAVIGIGRLLSETPLSLEQRQYVQMINDSGHLLLTIINDILDYSKIEAGHLKLNMCSHNVGDVVEAAVMLTYDMATSKGLSLSWYVEPSLPAALMLDSTRLQQILLNLLSNAIKFTKAPGGVELEMTGQMLAADTPDSRIQLTCRVKVRSMTRT